MSLPLFVDKNTNHTDTAGTTGTVNAPPTVAIGDLMILGIACGAGASITTLAGWNIIGSVQATTNTKQGAYWRIATSSDVGTPTYTWTFTGTTTTSAMVVAAWRGIYGNIDSNGVTTSTTSQNVTGPNTTAVSKCNMTVALHSSRDNTTTTSNAQQTTSTTGAVLRTEAVATIAGTAVNGIAIFDRLTALQPAGTVAGFATSCGTASPTEGVQRTFTLNCGAPDGTFDVNQWTMQRASLW